MTNTNIPCPLCKTQIAIDAQALLTGQKFNCPNTNCDASIGLAHESKDTVRDTMEKFEDLKNKGLE